MFKVLGASALLAAAVACARADTRPEALAVLKSVTYDFDTGKVTVEAEVPTSDHVLAIATDPAGPKDDWRRVKVLSVPPQFGRKSARPDGPTRRKLVVRLRPVAGPERLNEPYVRPGKGGVEFVGLRLRGGELTETTVRFGPSDAR